MDAADFEKIDEMFKHHVEVVSENFKHHVGMLSEDFPHKLDIVVEGQQMLSEKIDRLEVRVDVVEVNLSRSLDTVAAF